MASAPLPFNVDEQYGSLLIGLVFDGLSVLLSLLSADPDCQQTVRRYFCPSVLVLVKKGTLATR